MPENTSVHTPSIAQTLGLNRSTARRRKVLRLVVIGTTIIASVVGGAMLFSSKDSNATQYKQEDARIGKLVITVTATGTLTPVNQVDVGSELSGTIKKVEVDFNDFVKRGQVLARLDTEQLTARVVQAKASLDVAKAKLSEMTATVTETKTKFDRAVEMAKSQITTQQDVDAARAAFDRANAGLESAKAQVSLNQALLDADETNVKKSLIVSPIDGIVLSRKVEPGQTVAASFQTPVLFTLAEDLRQMELHVDVDEADVGQVQIGQHAEFTVDAYPNKRFTAKITKVHYAAKVTQDVVTYEGLLSVDNSNLLLRPGMTATADITTQVINDALLVPNAALRFTPEENGKKQRQTSALRSILPGPPPRPGKERKDNKKKKTQQVWLLRDGAPVAVDVETGATDGRYTQITGGALVADTQLIIDVLRNAKK